MSKPSLKTLMPPPEDKPDPLIKSLAHKEMMHLLFGPARKRLDKLIDELILKNMKISRGYDPFFVHQGITYIESNVPITKGMFPRIMPRLHRHLWPEMEAILIERKELDKEAEEISTGITTILNVSDHREDHLELIPNALHHALSWQSVHHSLKRIPAAELAEAKVKTKPCYDMLCQRLAANLLY